jgi:hypothetical protein
MALRCLLSGANRKTLLVLSLTGFDPLRTSGLYSEQFRFAPETYPPPGGMIGSQPDSGSWVAAGLHKLGGD